MKRKFIAILLICCIAAALSGCGGITPVPRKLAGYAHSGGAVFKIEGAYGSVSICCWERRSEPSYAFNDNLIGHWHIDNQNDCYDIWIDAVDSSSVTLRAAAVKAVKTGLFRLSYCFMEGKGTCAIQEGGFLLLPLAVENEISACLNIVLSPTEGVKSAYISQ